MEAYTRTYIHTLQTCTYTNLSIYLSIYLSIFFYIFISLYSFITTYLYKHNHTHTHTHTHTHIYIHCISLRYSVETITGTNYTDDLVLLAYTHSQAESLLHSLEQTARGIGLYMSTDKAEFMYFKEDETTSTLKSKHLK